MAHFLSNILQLLLEIWNWILASIPAQTRTTRRNSMDWGDWSTHSPSGEETSSITVNVSPLPNPQGAIELLHRQQSARRMSASSDILPSPPLPSFPHPGERLNTWYSNPLPGNNHHQWKAVRRERVMENRCLRCGEKGHRWGTCRAGEMTWKEWKGILKERRTCTICYQEGHWWRECRKTLEEWEEWKKANMA